MANKSIMQRLAGMIEYNAIEYVIVAIAVITVVALSVWLLIMVTINTITEASDEEYKMSDLYIKPIIIATLMIPITVFISITLGMLINVNTVHTETDNLISEEQLVKIDERSNSHYKVLNSLSVRSEKHRYAIINDDGEKEVVDVRDGYTNDSYPLEVDVVYTENNEDIPTLETRELVEAHKLGEYKFKDKTVKEVRKLYIPKKYKR